NSAAQQKRVCCRRSRREYGPTGRIRRKLRQTAVSVRDLNLPAGGTPAGFHACAPATAPEDAGTDRTTCPEPPDLRRSLWPQTARTQPHLRPGDANIAQPGEDPG